ncbi:MAG: Crp/Fnr family transcriptional regulator [Rhizobiaceae bacterium]|nr:MAG: Crp/Fnr family transcriptional regulator [Rhizobiaceae bacterium]
MSPTQSSTANVLLRVLNEDDYALLAPHLKRTRLKLKDRLFEPDTKTETVHFLESGVGSIVASHGGEDHVEVGLFGREGMSGVAVILDAGQSPHASMIQSGDPVSLAIASERLVDACEQSPALRNLLLRYAQSLSVQTALTAKANAQYALPERLARWLLMCHDRLDGDRLEITHALISMMLAVRRSGVTVSLHALEAVGAIKTTRGFVTVVDRARLEGAAGGSYGQAEIEYRRLIGPFGKGMVGHQLYR